MKNILKILSIVLILAAISSCQKKVLELESYNSFSDQSAYTTPDRVELAVNGAYDAAQSGFYASGQVRGYPFGAASIEQGDARGEDMLNVAAFFQITYEATYNPTTANNDFMFQTLYALINKANLTREGVRRAEEAKIIAADAANAYDAECRFLRAMAHHELVLNFSRPFADGNGSKPGIIYRETGIDSDAKIEEAKALKRSDFTVADNYTKILADLDFAEANLPATRAGNLKTYRATKAAAIALKMRVKLHRGDWPGVIAEGAKIVSGTSTFTSPIGGWALTASPDGPFANNLSTESIFSIKNDATDNAGVNGALANMLGNPSNGARGLFRVSPIIWSNPLWLCSDTRRSTLYSTTITGSDITRVFTTKYRDYSNNSDAAPMIRYAEVLLILAEAEARNASAVSATALSLLNAVRNRAVGSANAYTSFGSKNALIEAILLERRIELLGEGKRWGDISRLSLDANFAPVSGGGIPAKVGTSHTEIAGTYNCAGPTATITKSVPAIPYSDRRFLWPISQAEINQNPNFTQNPEY